MSTEAESSTSTSDNKAKEIDDNSIATAPDSFTTDEHLKNMCDEYAHYVDHSHATRPYVEHIKDGTLEQLLTRLDEYHVLLATITSERDGNDELLSVLDIKAEQLKREFAIVDALDTFVARLDASVDKLEDLVSAAERQSKTIALRNVFSSRKKSHALVHGFTPLEKDQLASIVPSQQSIESFIDRLKVASEDAGILPANAADGADANNEST